MVEINNVVELYAVLLIVFEDIAVHIMYGWDSFCSNVEVHLSRGRGRWLLFATKNWQKAAAGTSMNFAFYLCPQRSKAFPASFILQFVVR